MWLSRLVATLGILTLAAGPAGAQPGAAPPDIHLLVTRAIDRPLEAVLPAAEKSLGRHIVVEVGSARGNFRTAILAGKSFDVVLSLPDVNDELSAAGKLAPQRFRIARVPAGIGLRGDVKSVDVATPLALKATLLHARSVLYNPTGAALDTVRKIFSTLGIADAISDSSRLTTPVSLRPGEYEIILYPIPEILSDSTMRNLGPVMPEFQVPTVIEAAISKDSKDQAGARALASFLQGPAIDAALAASGVVKDITIH